MTRPGTARHVQLPHAELFEIGPARHQYPDRRRQIRLNVLEAGDSRIVSEVKVGGAVSDNKGINVPDVLVPIPALTDKDRDDLSSRSSSAPTGLPCQFVQRPEDLPRRAP